MLIALRLRDFVIVDALDLEFGPGFNVLTGETGAGKSILIDALGLATGGRAEATLVREGANRADIVAEFSTDATLDAWLQTRDLGGDTGRVLMRRILDADGRSRALINGHPVTVAQLRELGEHLLEVHGQHASQSLLRSEGQRSLLDRFAGLTDTLRTLAQAHTLWRERARDLERAKAQSGDRDRDRERLQWQVAELDQLSPRAGEWETLEAEQRRLAHAAALLEGTQSVADALTEGDTALVDRLHVLQQTLRPLAAVDPALSSVQELIDSATIQLREAASSLSDYAGRVDLDPDRLAEVEARLGHLHAAGRKFRVPPAELESTHRSLREALAQTVQAQDLEGLEKQTDAALAVYLRNADEVSVRRQTAARALAEGVSERIGRLGMKGGRLEIDLTVGEPAAHGRDRVEFKVAGHAGATPRALARVASGGELSRISLAISEWAAGANAVGTLIFDEADAGVGGAVAEAIGELMRALGDTRQVLCVTHLPQVAAKAHQHYSVRKESVGGSTVSRIDRLDRDQRVEEIARMLGGLTLSATTRRHARELLG